MVPTAAILERQIGKPPHIAQSYGVPHAGEDKLQLPSPVPALKNLLVVSHGFSDESERSADIPRPITV